MTEPRLKIFKSAEVLARQVADWLTLVVGATEGPVAIGLSGGSTPRRLYERLSMSPLPWDKIHWFWGDERFVPQDDELSNYRMVREALLDRAPISKPNIHPVPTEGITPEQSARAYEAELKRFYGAELLDPERPLFEVNFLGLGPDGHTASLFPGQPALEETERWVVPVVGVKDEDRISLTYPALDSARHIVFMVAGADKRDMLKRLLAGDDDIPAGRLRPTGELVIFADAAAAG